MKWHLSHLHWHISNQDNDRHGPHTDTGLVRIHFFTSCKHRHKKVLFLHKQTTGKKTCFAGALSKWGVMMAPPKMSELKLCVSQGGFLLCVGSVCVPRLCVKIICHAPWTTLSQFELDKLSWERKIHWKILSFSIFRHIKLLNLHLKTTGRCSPICHVVRFFLSRQCTIKAVQKDYNN